MHPLDLAILPVGVNRGACIHLKPGGVTSDGSTGSHDSDLSAASTMAGSVSRNDIGAEGARGFAAALESNTTLRSLKCAAKPHAARPMRQLLPPPL